MHVLLTGASGFLGSSCLELLLQQPTVAITALRSGETPIPLPFPVREVVAPRTLDYRSLASALVTTLPTHIIHCAAISSAERCEQNPEAATRANVEVTAMLARYAADIGAHLTAISTDLVFDGRKAPISGLCENDQPAPLSVYSHSKHAAEQITLNLLRSAVVRVSLLYGHSPSASKGVLGWIEKSFRERSSLTLFDDEYRTPVHVRDAAISICEIATRSLTGIWHCGGPARLSRVEFGRQIAASLDYDSSLIQARSRLTHPAHPQRPEDVSLNSDKLGEALGRSPLSVFSALSTYVHR